MTNEQLIATITYQTTNFKAEYLTRVAAWAKGEFARYEKLAVMVREYDSFATPGFKERVAELRAKGVAGVTGIDYEQGKAYHKFQNARHAARNIVEKGVEAFTAKMLRAAEQHYSDSIVKLVGRVASKGLDFEAVTVQSAHVGVNLEITLTDGVKTVRAFTIIASGPIQKPHYRYLIK